MKENADVNDLVPTGPANVIIGVCGDQGSGKTVFLTCIFQSIWTAFPDDVILDFDRDEIGNADYFQEVEERLIKKAEGVGTGVQSLYPARIYVKPYAALPDTLPPVLSVDIQDFAGRHFRSLANLKGLGAPSASEPDDVKALRQVNDIVRKADAFVILINATEIDPLNETPTRNPFSPSVNFLLAHCRAERKPVALLFSQIDQTPLLTEEMFHAMPRVQAFERQFTSVHAEADAGKRPFGVVRRIACYETVEGDLAPLRQTMDGNIWRPEPAKVVLDLIRAAMPRINARLQEAAAAALRQAEQQDLAAKRARHRRLLALIAALVCVLLITVGAVVAQHVHRESRTLSILSTVEVHMNEGPLASIEPPMEASLGEILNAHHANRSGTSRAIRAGIASIHAALAHAAERLRDQPSLDRAYSAEILHFRRLALLIDPDKAAEWETTILPLLEARTAFLSEWFAAGYQQREKALRLDEAARHFSADDQVFASILAAQSSKEKESSVASRRMPAAILRLQHL